MAQAVATSRGPPAHPCQEVGRRGPGAGKAELSPAEGKRAGREVSGRGCPGRLGNGGTPFFPGTCTGHRASSCPAAASAESRKAIRGVAYNHPTWCLHRVEGPIKGFLLPSNQLT